MPSTIAKLVLASSQSKPLLAMFLLISFFLLYGHYIHVGSDHNPTYTRFWACLSFYISLTLVSYYFNFPPL